MTFRNVWQIPMGDSHSFEAGYDLHAGNHTLDSEFIFTRHFAHTQYVYGHDNNTLSIAFLSGLISGSAPLFERFSLGNTSTLRGWNKFDVAPLGGNRVVHASLQYGFGGPHIGTFTNDRGQRRGIETLFHIFYDVGAVGDQGSAIKARHSVGFGLGKDTFFMSLGFPIRSSRVQPIFMAGFRF
jgi:outer membrane protein assembly factor BamA